MPRIPRGQTEGLVLHALNRGNCRAQVFHEPGEYFDFVTLLRKGTDRFPVQLFGYCLMPNHFHLVLRPGAPSALSDFLQFVLSSHVRRHHKRHVTSGHIWQGRTHSFPVQDDQSFLTLMRYVLLNPVKAKLAETVEGWRWSSLKARGFLTPWPVAAPKDPSWLHIPPTPAEQVRLKRSFQRRAPFGDDAWCQDVAERLGMLGTLQPRGRPRREG